MKIGYIRVSTREQNIARQEVLMEQLGVEKVYIDKISGKSTERPQLKKMMEDLKPGDTVIVEAISRFARNTKDLLTFVDRRVDKGVEFEHGHHDPVRPVYVDRIWRLRGIGAGIYSGPAAGGDRDQESCRRIQREQPQGPEQNGNGLETI